MYLRPDEVAQVLEKTGFIRDYVTDKAYGFHKGEHYVYVNREARMGRTALVIHPALGQKSLKFAHPAEPLRSSVAYTRFPQDPHAVETAFIGIPHGFTSRARLSQYLEKMFQQFTVKSQKKPLPAGAWQRQTLAAIVLFYTLNNSSSIEAASEHSQQKGNLKYDGYTGLLLKFITTSDDQLTGRVPP